MLKYSKRWYLMKHNILYLFPINLVQQYFIILLTAQQAPCISDILSTKQSRKYYLDSLICTLT